jgi:DNA-binding PadR family transcriptional regulator
MNPEKQQKIEDMLKGSAPALNKLASQEVAVPQRVKDALNVVLSKKYPVKLAAKEMESLLLKLVSEKPMDGFEISTRLERSNITLKEGGEGVLYGLLSALESTGSVEGRWRDSSERRIKTYHITDKGIRALQKKPGMDAQLKTWSDSVFAFDPSAT